MIRGVFLRGATVTDADRFKLLFGPYRTPRFKYGADRRCTLRGAVILCGLTDAPTPWLMGKRRSDPRAGAKPPMSSSRGGTGSDHGTRTPTTTSL
jgi:hypothetical protein